MSKGDIAMRRPAGRWGMMLLAGMFLLSACAANQQMLRQKAIQNDRVVGIWSFYGVALVDYDQTHPKPDPFEREVYARSQVAAVWLEAKAVDATLTDPVLDQLAGVKQKGLMREYVWTFLQNPQWSQPQGLDLAAFELWRKDHLKNHDPDQVLWLINQNPAEEG